MSQDKLEQFITEVVSETVGEIIAIIEFGSGKGKLYPNFSDIDIFILAENSRYIAHIISIVRKVEKSIFRTTHSKITGIVEKNYFASDDFTGIHLIAIGRDELDSKLRPKSLRLRLLTNLFVSTSLFFYHLKYESTLLYGEDIVKHTEIPKLNFKDRFFAVLPPLIFLLFLPLLSFNPKQFRIWCFKVLSYQIEYLVTFLKIYLHDNSIAASKLNLDQSLFDTISRFRYQPFRDHESNLTLYIRTFRQIVKNTSFLWLNPEVFLAREKTH